LAYTCPYADAQIDVLNKGKNLIKNKTKTNDNNNQNNSMNNNEITNKQEYRSIFTAIAVKYTDGKYYVYNDAIFKQVHNGSSYGPIEYIGSTDSYESDMRISINNSIKNRTNL
jgi:hypothetical protein